MFQTRHHLAVANFEHSHRVLQKTNHGYWGIIEVTNRIEKTPEQTSRLHPIDGTIRIPLSSTEGGQLIIFHFNAVKSPG